MVSLLFSPLSLGAKVAKNRVMRLPTISNLAEKSSVSDAMVAHVARISRGGVGVIVTEGMAVHASSVRGDKLVAAFRPETVPGLRRLGEAAHAEGALCIVQLLHGGRQHHSSRGLPWGPSLLRATTAAACRTKSADTRSTTWCTALVQLRPM
jgi:2,4-dienoyl-CoA reductase-like NADH-dependent reductase (Old Yellow Enzyme family)